MIQDIQSSGDTRAVGIDRVGIRRLKLPLLFTEDSSPTPTVGIWSADTDLHQDSRGTHMSRLVRFLHDHTKECDVPAFRALPGKLLEKLPAQRAFLSVAFTGFIEKQAPISGERGYVDTQVRMFVQHQRETGSRFLLQVCVPVTSLCPCSKAISGYGAHNQRSHVTVSVEPSVSEIRARDLIAVAEHGASCELYSVLKRADEKHITEAAYDNPKFVEDIVRDVAVVLQRESSVRHFRVEAENFESIHNHSAYGMIESEAFPAFMLS